MRAFRLPALVERVQPPRGGAGAGGVDIVLRRRRRDWKHDPLRLPLYYKPLLAEPALCSVDEGGTIRIGALSIDTSVGCPGGDGA